ncbi:flagellar accessory protein FlaH [Candidatus Woesearchaeota archaeon]|nr:flagellar accessory protein FlaH [Candidatus Woesearchaeota archaeon]
MAISSALFEDKGKSRSEKYNSISLDRDELAMNLGGGIPKNSLILAVGEDGAGKSIFSQRLAFGFKQNGASVAYISSELNTISFVEQMESLDYDVKYELLSGEFLFIPMFPVMGKSRLSKDFMSRLLATRQIFEKEIIIFDTLSFLLIQNSISEHEIYDLINVLKRMTTLGKTIIFCVDPHHLNETMLALLRSVSDIYLNLSIRSFAGNIVRVIEIIRFKRPQTNFQTKIPFRIETGKGLAIEIATLD